MKQKEETMETNNKNNNSEISLNLYKDNLDLGKIPQMQTLAHTVLDIETYTAESTEEKTLILSKKKKNPGPVSLKHVCQSLFYALQWPQLKRQLTKEGLKGMAKRHWTKTAVGTAACVLFLSYNNSEANNPNSFQGRQAIVAASVVDAMSQEELLIVSEDAKNNYIARFAGVAQGEMSKFGIPASITLGLSILHSNYGATELAQVGHNHFHINCTDNHLAEGITGRNVDNGQCYVHYQNAWTSFRANSLKLNTEDYQELKTIAGEDYTIWATGLQKMGYEKADELLEVIEKHELYEFDKK